MPKKNQSPDKRQDQAEPPLSLQHDMPRPGAADQDAFARRAGEIIARASTSLGSPPAAIKGRGIANEPWPVLLSLLRQELVDRAAGRVPL
jgi:hypothetical protein